MYTIITGAGAGIGKATAYEYAKNGKNLLLISLEEKDLKEIKRDLEKKYNVKVLTLSIDLTSETAENKIVEFIDKNNIEINCLINNAGMGFIGEFSVSDLDKQLKLVDLNVLSVTKLTYAILPFLKKSKNAKLVFISSIAGLLPCGPYQNIYYATKSYVTSFAMGLRSELKQYGIKVTTIYPGLTRSKFLETAGGKNKTEKGAFPPEIAARDIFKATQKGKKRKLTALTFSQKMFFILLPIIPKSMVIKSTEKIQKSRLKKRV